MPYVREGSVKTSDHWLRSPLVNINGACQTCHNYSEEELKARIDTIQNRTAELLRQSEEALLDTIDAIVAAKNAGATDEELAEIVASLAISQGRDVAFDHSSGLVCGDRG